MGYPFRDTVAGFFVRFLSRNRFLKYPEEIEGFKILNVVNDAVHSTEKQPVSSAQTPTLLEDENELDENIEETLSSRHISADVDDAERGNRIAALYSTMDNVTHFVRTKDGIILVGWYSTDDPANPHNWTSGTKSLVCGEICVLTFSVYIGSSAYAPAIPAVMAQFGCSETVASLGLALYVVGYGLGPLLFSPLSEIPMVGRNGLYIATFFMYILLVIPTALTNNLPAFLVARFLCAFFGSPSLSTSPASFTDMLTLNKLPYVLAIWSASATMAPALGPITVGYALQVKDWHWSMFELLWLAAPIFVFLFFLLPETSADNILLRRAARLRALTGNPNFKSQSEINQANLSIKEVLFDALIKPWEMNILDPAILFSTGYVALCYAIFYSFFEAFPLVFSGMHGFSLGSSGLTFLAIPVALVIAIPLQLLHFAYRLEPFIMRHGTPVAEFWLENSLFVSVFAPIGLFIFAWTSSPEIHWIVPLLGVIIFQGPAYMIMNAQFAYIANIYPNYAASLFAANAAARSCLAAGAVLFSRPLFLSLGVGGGVSLLASTMAICSILLWVLYYTGATLRKRSRFVSH